MSTTFKNRLVGTIVFVAAGVIILPELLDGHQAVRLTNFQAIPKRPLMQQPEPLPPLDESVKEKLAQMERQVLQDEQAADDQLQLASAPPGKDQSHTAEHKAAGGKQNKQTPRRLIAESGAPAWVIQLGSFSNKERTRILVENLRNAGFSVFTRPVNTHVGLLTKVMVGPDVDKTRLEKMLPELKSRTRLDGKIVPFRPAE